MDNFYGPLSVRIYITPYLNWEKLGGREGRYKKGKGYPTMLPQP